MSRERRIAPRGDRPGHDDPRNLYPLERMGGGATQNPVVCARPRKRMIDTHEILKAEIYAQGGDPVPSGVEPPPPLIPPPEVVGFEDVELYFDSRQRDAASDYSVGEIRWDVTMINSNNDIKGCIQMHLNEFYLPRPYAPPTSPDYFYEQRVFMEFLGAPTTQAVLAGPLGRFHVEFRVENISGQAVRLVPLKKSGSFFFQRPLTSITEFYVRFMVPQKSGPLFKRINLLPETVMATVNLVAGAGTNPIQFTVPSTSVLGAVGAIPPVAVWFSGLATPNLAVNAAVNNPDGLFVVNILDSTTFEVAGIDGTSLVALHTSTLYIPKNRIAMPVRFTCTRSTVTNNVAVTHD